MAEDIKEIKAANKELKAENKDLKNTLSALLAQVQALQSKIDAINQPVVEAAPIVNTDSKVSPYDNVVIVHLVDNFAGGTTHIELSSTTIDMVGIGETRTLTLSQFEELVGKYRSWFQRGVLAVASGYEQYAERNNLSTDSSEFVTSDFIKNLGDLPMSTIEDVYNKICDGQKEFLLSYWKRKMIAGDGKFKDISKVQKLDGISGGKFEYELQSLIK